MTTLLVRAHRRLPETGGQSTRGSWAIALALDEPTSSLDLRHQTETMQLIEHLVTEQGLCAVMAIHDLNLAGRHCDQVAALHGGRVVAHGSPLQVYTPAVLEQVYGVAVQVSRHGLAPEVRPVGPTARSSQNPSRRSCQGPQEAL